ELGCGPGHVAAYLREREVDITGVDLSFGMLAAGRPRFAGLPLLCADMHHLPAASGALGGLVAMYSIIHTPAGRLPNLLRECLRVLRPGAPLLLAFHMGAHTLRLENWWETPVELDFHFFDARIVNESLLSAGFVLEQHHERQPYAGVEHASRRAYILASRPG
ncbi:MAG TPA: class I SAM-dependent methyltransferase, partial [Anaerolineaceae bacterium]